VHACDATEGEGFRAATAADQALITKVDARPRSWQLVAAPMHSMPTRCFEEERSLPDPPARARTDLRVLQMINAANMNPLFLDFPNFLIAQDDEKQVVGIGQIRPLGIFLCMHRIIASPACALKVEIGSGRGEGRGTCRYFVCRQEESCSRSLALSLSRSLPRALRSFFLRQAVRAGVAGGARGHAWERHWHRTRQRIARGVSVSVSVSVSVFVLSVSVSVFVFSLSLSLSLSHTHSMCLCLRIVRARALSLYLSVSFSLTQSHSQLTPSHSHASHTHTHTHTHTPHYAGM